MEDAKWETIVRAAGDAFGRFGFKKASIEEIARAAGVAKGTVYLGCASKRDLFYQAILRDLRLWNAELAKTIDPRVNADELLLRVSEASYQTMDRYPLARDLILGKFDADLPDWVEHLDELRGSGLTTILEILRLGVRQGRFRAEMDMEAMAGILLDLTTTTIMFYSRGDDVEDRLARRAMAIYDLALNGLLDPKRSKKS